MGMAGGTRVALATDPRERFAGHVALVFVQVGFGLFPVFAKLAFEPGAFTPRSLTAWRFLFGAGALLALAFAVHGRAALPRRGELPRLVICSLLGVTINMALYLEGLSRSTATNAGLMMCLIPVFTFAVAAAVGQERFRVGRLAGVLTALAGASLLFWYERPELARAHGLGNALMAVNTLSYALYLVLSRPLLARLPPLVLVAWVFALAAPFAPLLLRGETLVPEASPRAWWALVYILAVATCLAYVLNAFALARLRASTTAIYVYLQPLITGLLGWLWLGERVTGAMGLAAVLVFAGIWLVSRPPAPAPEPMEA